MWAFISELGAALAETASSDAKFRAFADRLRALSTSAPPQLNDLLRKDLLLSSIKAGPPLIGAPQDIVNSLQSKIDASSTLWKSANDLLLKRSANTASLSYKAPPLDGIWATATLSAQRLGAEPLSVVAAGEGPPEEILRRHA
jgi:hypothetical protein